jgi:catechol 2,3-dioxygenase-like lactoylglutathione lyase family enzyme
MTMTYHSSVIFVEDVRQSRRFYTEILGQKVVQDYGRYIGFENGFGIWEREYAMSVIYPDQPIPAGSDRPQTELYFESDQLDRTIQILKDNHVHFIHDLYEHEWGQRGIRIQDPDGIIVEISEPISAVVRRFFDQRFTAEQIAGKTGMPISEIESYR